MQGQHDAALGISGSWLNEDSPAHLIQLDGYKERPDRAWGDKIPSGGLAIYIHKDFLNKLSTPEGKSQ